MTYIYKYCNSNNNNKIWNNIRTDMNYITFATVYGSIFGNNYPSPNDKLLLEFIEYNNKFFDVLFKVIAMRLFFPTFLVNFALNNLLKYEEIIEKLDEIVVKWIDNYEQSNNGGSTSDNDNQNDNKVNDGLYYELLKHSPDIIKKKAEMIADMQASFQGM